MRLCVPPRQLRARVVSREGRASDRRRKNLRPVDADGHVRCSAALIAASADRDAAAGRGSERPARRRVTPNQQAASPTTGRIRISQSSGAHEAEALRFQRLRGGDSRLKGPRHDRHGHKSGAAGNVTKTAQSSTHDPVIDRTQPTLRPLTGRQRGRRHAGVARFSQPAKR